MTTEHLRFLKKIPQTPTDDRLSADSDSFLIPVTMGNLCRYRSC